MARGNGSNVAKVGDRRDNIERVAHVELHRLGILRGKAPRACRACVQGCLVCPRRG